MTLEKETKEMLLLPDEKIMTTPIEVKTTHTKLGKTLSLESKKHGIYIMVPVENIQELIDHVSSIGEIEGQ